MIDRTGHMFYCVPVGHLYGQLERSVVVSHPIVHVEIPVTDYTEAPQFYQQLFGWNVQQYPEMNYAVFQARSSTATTSKCSPAC